MSPPRRRFGNALAAIALALPGATLAVCAPPERAVPVQDSVADRQTPIAWKAVPGATGYRVRVQSRVPNGRIVASYDTIVASTSFVSPQPFAEDHAKVTARISAICGSEASAESVFAFVVDATSTCRLQEISAETAGTKTTVKWPAVSGAASYELRVFSLEGALVSVRETRAPAAQVELKQPGAVLSVRPACASGLGEAVYRIVGAAGSAN